jgi:hypothetical protein
MANLRVYVNFGAGMRSLKTMGISPAILREYEASLTINDDIPSI